MYNLEKDLQDFENQQLKIDSEIDFLKQMENEIIKKYCSFKKGDKVIFTEWWRGNNKDYYGIVYSIQFKGINENAINEKWVICVIPTTKDFIVPKNSYNKAFKHLGKVKGDIIRKA
jgi:hypothetical protein